MKRLYYRAVTRTVGFDSALNLLDFFIVVGTLIKIVNCLPLHNCEMATKMALATQIRRYVLTF